MRSILLSTIAILSPLSLGAVTRVHYVGASNDTHLPTRAATGDRSSYRIQDFYQGDDFLRKWNFFSDADPTHGAVNYQSRQDAISKHLARADGDVAILAVDSKTRLQPGQHRDSVRIVSPKTYTGGLFIADFAEVPYGPTTWPAWWTVGSDWPNNGEMDILEGVNDNPTNQYALHTASGCHLDDSKSGKAYSGKTGNLDCTSGAGSNTGCTIMDTDPQSYGKGFNRAGGGVYAHLWDEQGIKIWHFSRSDIPSDIKNKNPDPSKWGIPAAFYSASTCNPAKYFRDHNLVINTTLCGDWAGSVFPGGMEACLQAVQDPKNFSNAIWKINYIAVYSDRK